MNPRAQRVKEMVEDRILIAGVFFRLFETEDGKIALRKIIREGFILKSTFVAGDPHQTVLNEGSRRLALILLRLAKKTPQQMMRQLEESVQDENT